MVYEDMFASQYWNCY